MGIITLQTYRLSGGGASTQRANKANPKAKQGGRRQALVEMDVIAAMAFGLSLEDLEITAAHGLTLKRLKRRHQYPMNLNCRSQTLQPHRPRKRDN